MAAILSQWVNGCHQALVMAVGIGAKAPNSIRPAVCYILANYAGIIFSDFIWRLSFSHTFMLIKRHSL